MKSLCSILAFMMQLLFVTNNCIALPCQQPTIQQTVDCINNALQSLSVYDVDPNNNQSVPIMIFRGVNFKVLSTNATDGTGNLLVGDGHTFQDSSP